MNTLPTSPRPALTCRIARGWHAVFGREAMPRTGHLATCPDCRAALARDAAFDAALRHDARVESVAPRAGFEESLIRAVQRSTREADAPVRGWSVNRAGWLPLAAAAACAVIAFVALRQPPARPAPAGHVSGDLANEAVAALEAGAIRFFDAVGARTDALLQRDPVRTEVAAVYADARIAIDFLALNFLPPTPAPAAAGNG